jgi:hypothetical protein
MIEENKTAGAEVPAVFFGGKSGEDARFSWDFCSSAAGRRRFSGIFLFSAHFRLIFDIIENRVCF